MLTPSSPKIQTKTVLERRSYHIPRCNLLIFGLLTRSLDTLGTDPVQTKIHVPKVPFYVKFWEFAIRNSDKARFLGLLKWRCVGFVPGCWFRKAQMNLWCLYPRCCTRQMCLSGSRVGMRGQRGFCSMGRQRCRKLGREQEEGDNQSYQASCEISEKGNVLCLWRYYPAIKVRWVCCCLSCTFLPAINFSFCVHSFASTLSPFFQLFASPSLIFCLLSWYIYLFVLLNV